MDLNFFKTLNHADTPLLRLDGRVKTVFFLVCVIVSAVVTHWYLAAALWLAALSLFYTLRLPWAPLLNRLLIPFGISWFVLLNLIFTNGDHPLWVLFRKPFVLNIYAEGISLGMLMMLRIMATVSMATVLSFSTPMVEVLETLRICGLPKTMIEIAEIMFRYSFIVYDVARNMRHAQNSRTVRRLSWIEQTGNVGKVAAHVIFKSIDRSLKIYNAMLARGYSENSVALKYFTSFIPSHDLRRGMVMMSIPIAALVLNFYI